MPSNSTTLDTLLGRIRGHQLAAMIHLAARIDLPDRVGNGRGVQELADELRLNSGALRRMVRALAAFDIFTIDDHDHVGQTEASRLLMSDAPRSLHAAASFWGMTCSWQAWEGLEYAVRTGECAFEHRFGTPLFDYLDDHPECGRVFNRFMAAGPDDRHAAVVSAYDFLGFGCVADIGGGDGMLLAAVLRAAPRSRAILFDRASVVATPVPAIAPFVQEGRCEIVAGDFFEGLPSGADAYLLSQIIHDWGDDDALAILRNCRKAARQDATLLLIERDLDLDPGRARSNANNFLSDIEMLINHKAAERTTEQYRALLHAAGFRIERIVRTDSPFYVLECIAD